MSEHVKSVENSPGSEAIQVPGGGWFIQKLSWMTWGTAGRMFLHEDRLVFGKKTLTGFGLVGLAMSSMADDIQADLRISDITRVEVQEGGSFSARKLIFHSVTGEKVTFFTRDGLSEFQKGVGLLRETGFPVG